jgi:hypothetical protein
MLLHTVARIGRSDDDLPHIAWTKNQSTADEDIQCDFACDSAIFIIAGLTRQPDKIRAVHIVDKDFKDEDLERVAAMLCSLPSLRAFSIVSSNLRLRERACPSFYRLLDQAPLLKVTISTAGAQKYVVEGENVAVVLANNKNLEYLRLDYGMTIIGLLSITDALHGHPRLETFVALNVHGFAGVDEARILSRFLETCPRLEHFCSGRVVFRPAALNEIWRVLTPNTTLKRIYLGSDDRDFGQLDYAVFRELFRVNVVIEKFDACLAGPVLEATKSRILRNSHRRYSRRTNCRYAAVIVAGIIRLRRSPFIVVMNARDLVRLVCGSIFQTRLNAAWEDPKVDSYPDQWSNNKNFQGQ